MSAARLVLAIVTIVAGNAAVGAQTRSGVVVGTVIGDDGNRLAGLSVTVENATIGLRRTATTDEQGHYEITDLPVGSNYAVRVALAGFATVENDRVTIAASGSTTVDFVIRLTMRETVAVNAAIAAARGEPVASCSRR